MKKANHIFKNGDGDGWPQRNVWFIQKHVIKIYITFYLISVHSVGDNELVEFVCMYD